jgi:hypothetical protein
MRFKSIAEFLALTGEDAPTTAERKLIEATQAGRDCYLCDRKNLARPTEATDKTRIRASLLRLLIIGGTPACNLYERGVTLLGGWIDGTLDLGFCTASGQTVLCHCLFPDKPRMEEAQFAQLILENSAFPKGLFAQGARVKGSVYLRGIIAADTIDVNTAKVGGQLVFDGASLAGGKGTNGAQQMALNAQGVEAGQDLFLGSLTATGTVAVPGAKIGGQLACNGAIIYGGKDATGEQLPALNAHGVETGRDLILSGLAAKGSVMLVGAKIGGQLACEYSFFDGSGGPALEAQRLSVMEGMVFRKVKKTAGWIDLTSAHVGDLVDDISSWPTDFEMLSLGGFTYDRLSGTAPTTFAARSDWLAVGSRSRGEFLPQPYTHFARVLRQMGHAGEARKVLVKRESLLSAHLHAADRAAYQRALNGDPTEKGDAGWIWLRMTGAWFWSELTRRVAGHGYAPQYALYWSLACVALSFFAYFFFWRLGAMVPANAVLLASPDWAAAVASNPKAPSHAWQGPAATHYETFYSLTYALDVFLPIVDLGQQSTWGQTTATWWGWSARLYTWALQISGWVVTTLGVAAVTGVIQRNQPD